MNKTERLKKINQYTNGDENSFSDSLIEIKFQFNDKGIKKLNIGHPHELFSILKYNQEKLKHSIFPLVKEFVKKLKLFDISINFLTYPLQKESTSVFVSILHKNTALCDLVLFDIKNPKTFQEFFELLIFEISQKPDLDIKNWIFNCKKECEKIKYKRNDIFYTSDFMASFFQKYSTHLTFCNFGIDILIKSDIEYLFNIRVNNNYFELKQKTIPNSETEMLRLFCDMEYIKVPYEDAKNHDLLNIIEMDRLMSY